MTGKPSAEVKIKPADGGKLISIDPAQTNLVDELEALSSSQVRFGRKARSSDVGWPEPMGKAAHHGIAGDVLSMFEGKTEADPAAILAQFLAGFGNMIGRQHYAQVERSRHYPLLWVAIVGSTAKARKGTSWGVAGHLLREVDESWFQQNTAGGLSSGEGILYRVRDGDDADDGDKGVDDKRLLVVEEELASVLRVARREGNTLSPMMRRLWDSGTVQSMTRGNPLKTTDSHISLVGHIVRSELRRELTETDAANGLANRFLFVLARRGPHLPDGAGVDPTEEALIVRRVLSAYEWARSAKVPTVVNRDSAARERWHEVYAELGDVDDDLAGAITSRAEAQVLRLSLIYALLDKSRVVRLEHLEAALEVWRYSEQSAYLLFDGRSGSTMKDRIFEAIRNAGDAGISRTGLQDALSRHAKKAELDDLLGDLEAQGLVVVVTEPTRGHPWTLYFIREKSETANKVSRS